MGSSKNSKGFGEMNWFREFAIDDTGRCHWREGMRVEDPALFESYRKSALAQFVIESSAIFGVKVGQA